MELAFAAVHQVCAPMLDRLERLPGPQREALGTAFGISAGPTPDRFLVSLAVLGLLSDVAGERPLVCLVDDQQWLDRASAQVLAFVARRLQAESVGLVFAARAAGEELAGLPELVAEGLRGDDARALLDSAFTGPLDARVRDQIVAEAWGNPLALLELPRGLTPAELAGGFGLPGAIPLAGRVEGRLRRELDALPGETRGLAQVAAAGPVGGPVLGWRGGRRAGGCAGGAAGAGGGLGRAAEAAPKEALRSAEVEHLRGQIALDQRRGSDAARLLLSAARRFEPLNPGLARETHLEALWEAAMQSGDLDRAGGMREAAEAARAAPPGPAPPRVIHVLLDAFALRSSQ